MPEVDRTTTNEHERIARWANPRRQGERATLIREEVMSVQDQRRVGCTAGAGAAQPRSAPSAARPINALTIATETLASVPSR